MGETTCDAKKKAWDLLGFTVMEVPQKKGARDRALWRAEVDAFREKVEALSGVRVTAERLREAIGLVNRKRRALLAIAEFRKLDEPPISGVDALVVSQTALNMDTRAFCEAAEALAEELRDRAERGVPAYEGPGMRVLVAGTPSPLGFAKVHHALETSGLRVVADESCTGLRYARTLVDDAAADLEGLLDAVADRYFAIDCPCFSPNDERMENVAALAEAYRVSGVVHLVLQYCHGFNVEAKKLDGVLAERGLPAFKVVTDYGMEDLEQLRVRLEAFRETAAARGS